MSLALVLRLIHIVLGVFWAGTLFFLVVFLAPAMGRVGPDAGKVMAQLNRARFFEIMPLAALLTLVSGVWLMGIRSSGFSAAFFTGRYGLALTVGGVAAVAAFVIGTMVMRPATLRILDLGPRLGAVGSEEERQALGAQVQALRQRSRTSSVWVAVLLLVAVVSMAAARYL